MEKAIKKAIEGGFRMKDYQEDWVLKWRMYEIVTLDPLFWQALFKTKENKNTKINGVRIWHWNWLRFIDHLAEGKEAEEFFSNLIQ